MNNNLIEFGLDIFHVLLEKMAYTITPIQKNIATYGVEEIYTAGGPYIQVTVFDFIDKIINGFVYLLIDIVEILSRLSIKIIDLIGNPDENGIPVRSEGFVIGDSEFFKYEILKKLTAPLNFFEAFHRRHIIKTLVGIPGGLDIPEDVLLSVRYTCEGLERFYEGMRDTSDSGLGKDQLPLKVPEFFHHARLTIDEDVPSSMKSQGNNFNRGRLWFTSPSYYKFYRSNLYEWFQQVNNKTQNLNDLGLSNLDKLAVLDNLWTRPGLSAGLLGMENLGPVNLDESYLGGVSYVGKEPLARDSAFRVTYNYRYAPQMIGATMKIRLFDALNDPRGVTIPFLSNEAVGHLGMFRNFGECHKPIFINNEFYMEGFENKFLAHYDLIMLPDFVSRFLQLRFNLVDNDKITQVQYIIALSLRLYSLLIGVRYLLFWLIGLNPYQNFFSSLIATSVDWIETLLGAYVPSLYGIPLSIPLFMVFLNGLIGATYSLTFTFPYLPSEASIQYIYGNSLLNIYPQLRNTLDPWDLKAMEKFFRTPHQDNKYIQFINECRPFLRFEGLPKLWVEKGIPDQIRFSWFWKHPLIFKKYYQDFEVSRIESNIQFLPNIVLKDLNSNLHNLNLHDLQKMNTKELYSFLLENLSQNLRTDLVNLLLVESNAKHIDVSDFLDPARLEIYSEILKKVFDIN